MGKHESHEQLAVYCSRLLEGAAWADTGEEAAKHIESELDWRPPARRIDTATDADRLPIGTVVMNDGGQVAQRYDGAPVWWQVLDGDQVDSANLIGTGYITVLHDPNEVAQ